MSDLEFQKRFPNLYNQQQAQQQNQGAFGAPLGSGTPYQSTTPAAAAGNAPVTTAPLDITSPLNLGAGVYGNASTPSNLATSMYGDAALGTLPGGQTAQPAFGSIAQPITQTGQAAFGNIAQPLTASSLAEEVVGLDGQKVDANDSGMTDQMIEQLQVAEDARFKQVVREEEEKKLAAERAEEERKREEAAAEARLTPEQRLEKYTPKLQEQILGQQLTDKWSGGYGPQDSSRDIAKILASAGITDIRQFGKIKKTVPDTDAEGNPTTREVEVFGNKVTGQEIEKRSGRWQRQGGSDLFAGTGLGDGNTGYRVQFTDDGTPVFYTTKGSSSDLYKLAPILAVASFIPALAPFAQGLNALIALKQKNILGALGSFAGLGSQLSGLSGISGQLSNISNAANFASAAKNKNILGMLSAGANLGGTDLEGLAKASGIGDVTGLAGLNLGGLGVSDALKAYRTVQAVKSGDPTSMIYALGGYAKDAANKDQNAKGFASAADISRSLAGRQGAPERFERFDLPSVDDDFASSYGLGRVPDDLTALLPELPKFGSDDLTDLLPKLPKFADTQNEPSESGNKVPNMSGRSFGSAFAEARAAGEKEFMWNGKAYNTNLGSKEAASYDSVGGGRGGQGGATAEQLARANAVRGNPPESEVSKFVSSLFPSAEGKTAPSYAGAGRGRQGGPTAQELADYELPQDLGPYVGYKNAYNMKPKMGDINQLPDPRTYAAVSGFLGQSPDEQGFSVLHPDYPGIKDAGEAGFYSGVGAQLLPVLGQAGKALSRLKGSSSVDEAAGMAGRASNFSLAESETAKFNKTLDSMMGNIDARDTLDKSRKLYEEGDVLGAYKALEMDPATRKGMEQFAVKYGADKLPFKPEGLSPVGPNILKDEQTKAFMSQPDPTRFGPQSSTWNNFVLRTSNQYPSSGRVGRILDEAIDLINSGDKVGSYKLLESDPETRKLITDFARQSGAKEIGPYKQPARILSPEVPPQYLKGASEDRYARNPQYKPYKPPGPTIGRKAEGGLASLTKRQMSKA
jgi:hypothetical protein